MVSDFKHMNTNKDRRTTEIQIPSGQKNQSQQSIKHKNESEQVSNNDYEESKDQKANT